MSTTGSESAHGNLGRASVRTELWSDGEGQIMYTEDRGTLVRVLSWKPVANAGVDTMAEYCDRRGKAFAWQIRLPNSFANMIKGRLGLSRTRGARRAAEAARHEPVAPRAAAGR